MKIQIQIVLILAFLMGFSPIFSQDIIIESIRFSGNDKTHASIILRELMFEKGDTISSKDWKKIKEQSEENLVNTSLFHSASIQLIPLSDNRNQVEIKVVERWYLWPEPVLDIDERNFNVWWQQKNLNKLSAGFFITKQNFRGRMEEVKLLAMIGYNKRLGFSYDAPYVNKKKTFGLGGQFIYTLKHEVDMATLADKQLFYKNNNPVQTDYLASIHFRYRPSYFVNHLLQFRYQNYIFSSGLVAENQEFTYKDFLDLKFISMYYKLKVDHRDYKSYPLRGYYLDAELWQFGFGILNNKELNVGFIKTNMRKYWSFSERWYGAAGLIAKVSNSSKQPYFLKQGLGYGRDFVRGYEYYVVQGEHYLVMKSNIKYALFPQRDLKLAFIKTEKFNTVPYAFYLNVFADAGYAHQREISPNYLPNTWMYSAGLGLDFVTYYDKVARFELAVNRNGKMGFYLHFIAPI